MKKILVTARSFGRFPEDWHYLPAPEYEILPNPYRGKTLTEAQLCEVIGKADAAIIGVEQMTETVYAAAPHLKLVQRMGAGVDNVHIDLATQHGVAVANVPGASTNAVAELTLALLLCLYRQIVPNNRRVMQGQWVMDWGAELYGKTLGVVGFGRIGRAVAQKAKQGFGMNIVVYDFAPDRQAAAALGACIAEDLAELCAQADCITLHLPVTEETAGLIDANAIACMKDGVYLINTARGALWEESALLQALRCGKVAAAAADVQREEPPRRRSPLLDCENYLQTSHIGANTEEAAREVSRIAAANVRAVLSGTKCPYVLNPEIWKEE